MIDDISPLLDYDYVYDYYYYFSFKIRKNHIRFWNDLAY